MSFFKPKISARKCSCGEAFAFKVGEMLQFINQGGQEDARWAFIGRQALDAMASNWFSMPLSAMGVIVRRCTLPKDCLKQLDKGILNVFYNQFKNLN